MWEKVVQEGLQGLQDANLLRTLSIIDRIEGPYIEISGTRYLSFGSNDYLGLSRDPGLVKEAVKVAREFSWGTGSSRLITGTTRWHILLEQALATFKNKEAAIVFPSGYMANLGLITSIADKTGVIFSDQLNHASLVDGCRLSKAKVVIYQHCDVNGLRCELRRYKGHPRKIIVTESLFSMDGDLAPLRALAQLAETFKATLIVDEAHATGVFGRSGRGLLEHLGLERHPRIISTGTLSKAVGGIGGFVVGSFELIRFLQNRAREFIYTTAMPPAVCAANIAGIDRIRTRPGLRKRLWENISFFYQMLKDHDLPRPALQTPILPIVVGSAGAALECARFLKDHKVFVPAIRPPTVPEGLSRLRISITALHRKKELAYLAELLAKLQARLGLFQQLYV
jgi:8-amino-7-oxononanoate synthase